MQESAQNIAEQDCRGPYESHIFAGRGSLEALAH